VEVQRFLAEARAAASLQHPNIVAIHEVGEHEGQPYFCMDFVEGQSLAERTRDTPLPPELAADYLRVIAQAVQYAHERGLLHRDLKPSNILIDSLDQPRITDFGLAKRLAAHEPFLSEGRVTRVPDQNDASARRTELGESWGLAEFVPPRFKVPMRDFAIIEAPRDLKAAQSPESPKAPTPVSPPRNCGSGVPPVPSRVGASGLLTRLPHPAPTG